MVFGRAEVYARQLSSWKKTKRQAAESFISVVENKPLLEITRADAQMYCEHWLDRINGTSSGSLLHQMPQTRRKVVPVSPAGKEQYLAC